MTNTTKNPLKDDMTTTTTTTTTTTAPFKTRRREHQHERFFRFTSSSSSSSRRRRRRRRSITKATLNDDTEEEEESALPEAIRYTDDREFFENVELSPFLRPRGSPVLASTTDPTVWKCMQKVLREGDVEQMCVLSFSMMWFWCEEDHHHHNHHHHSSSLRFSSFCFVLNDDANADNLCLSSRARARILKRWFF